MDLGNNRDHYYLAGPMGNHVGMQVDADGDDQTDRELMTQVFDAFDVAVTPGLFATGRYAFRGQEGSATDDTPGLIEMGARSYDPQLGRFIQADSMPISNLSSQGLNRYVYGLNDPVNLSDPTGLAAAAGLLSVAGAVFGLAAIVVGVQLFLSGAIFAGLSAILADLALIIVAIADAIDDCEYRLKRDLMNMAYTLFFASGVALAYQFGFAAAGFPVVEAGLKGVLAGALVALGGGFHALKSIVLSNP